MVSTYQYIKRRFGGINTSSSFVSLLFLWLIYNNNKLFGNKNTIISIYGQQTPYAIVPKFDRTVSYRTNVCDRQLMLYNGTSYLPNALQGLNLTVAITNYQTGKETLFFSLNPTTNAIDTTNPGVFALILDELAIRAGFQWRDTYVPYPPLDPLLDGNKTWTDILSWATNTFDISMERWAQTVERLAIPTSFPIAWYDNSVVLGELIQLSSQNKNHVFNVWSFLDPFELTVWLCLLCCIIITGMVYYVLELWNINADELELECKPIASIFYAAITFTGHYELRPQTHPARLVGFSFTFWSLIVGAAYTANLASFLVSPRTPSFKYNTIPKILKNKALVCVQKGGAIGKLLLQLYPDIKLVPQFPDEEIFKGLRYKHDQNGCDVVAHQFNTFEIYENLRETNEDCAMQSEKHIIEVIPAGLATAVDTGSQYCTSLISHVLDYHLASMLDDGFIERIWKSQLDRIASVSCSNMNTNGVNNPIPEDGTISLTIQDVGGIFIVHVVLSSLAIAIAAIQFYYTHQRGAINDDRTLSKAFGIQHAKQIIERKLSQRDINLSNDGSSSLSVFKRTNSDLLNPKQVHYNDTTTTNDNNNNKNNNDTLCSISENSPHHNDDLHLHENENEL
jgi:hypothetical protein